MSTVIFNYLKQIIQKVSDAGKPTEYEFATVVSENPVIFQNGDMVDYPAVAVTVPKEFTDYELPIVIDGELKNITVLNHLKVGERVILLRKSGGQKFIVIGRLV